MPAADGDSRAGHNFMLNCNLTKPENTFDQVRKTYPDLKPTDAALVATAIVECGRLAHCVYDGKEYKYPNRKGLTDAIAKELHQIKEAEEGANGKKKKKSRAKKTTEEVEPVELDLLLRPNTKAGDRILGGQEELKTLVSDILQEGVNYKYSMTDIGWHWALERTNWTTAGGEELDRHVVFVPEFEGNIEASEQGKAKRKRKK